MALAPHLANRCRSCVVRAHGKPPRSSCITYFYSQQRFSRCWSPFSYWTITFAIGNKGANMDPEAAYYPWTRLPGSDDFDPILFGEAVAISGLSPDAPLYDPNMSPDERRSLKNALWLCKICARRIWKELDAIPEPVRVDYLTSWRDQAAERAVDSPIVVDIRSVTRTELALQDIRKSLSRLRWKRFTPDELYEELIDSLAVYVDSAGQYPSEVRCAALHALGEFLASIEPSHFNLGCTYVDYEEVVERICAFNLQLLPALEPATEVQEPEALWLRLALENVRAVLSVATGHFYSLSHALNALRSIRAALEKVVVTREVTVVRAELQELFEFSLKNHERGDISLANEFVSYIRYLANGTRHPELRQQLQALKAHTDKQRIAVKPLRRKL